MESLLKLKRRTLVLCFFYLSIISSKAQQIHNYNDVVFQSNNELKSKVDFILNSNDLVSTESNHFSRSSSTSPTILDIRYERLNLINRIDTSQISNLKYCILRLRNNVNPINLEAINVLTNLELLHIIIETDYISYPTVININNLNLIITYQISVPQ